MDLSSDLKHIVSEYESYFPEISFVRDSSEGPTPKPHIQLRTNEGDSLLIGICEAGWFILGSAGFYETFEALMGAHSRGFRDTFANNLFAKLQQLSESNTRNIAN